MSLLKTFLWKYEHKSVKSSLGKITCPVVTIMAPMD